MNARYQKFTFIFIMLLFWSCGSNTNTVPLSVNDFKFDGPLGSAGATIEQLDENYFRITLGHAPEHPDWTNKLNFQITGHALDNSLRLVVEGPPRYSFNEYFQSYSYDEENWMPIQWELGYQESTIRDTLIFPKFKQDEVWVGTQVPLSYEQVEDMVTGWRESEYVDVHTLGKSLGGRNLYRITITDPQSDIPMAQRWVHYFSNQHPGEHNSQWRMIGMIEWLLEDDAGDFRKRSIAHFILMMSPDGPHNGWYRVNAEGVDMNRSYRPEGADENDQAHEAYIFQNDLENLMQSDTPVTTIWAMHTWQGPVEPLIRVGPEIDNKVGSWTDFRDILQSTDPDSLIEPLKTREGEPGYGPVSWAAGPNHQFGITGVLCEGAGNIYTKEENKQSGVSIIRALAEFYRGTK